jgi:hypothetical protein
MSAVARGEAPGLVLPGAAPIDRGAVEAGVAGRLTRNGEPWVPWLGLDGEVGLAERVALLTGVWVHPNGDELTRGLLFDDEDYAEDPVEPEVLLAARALLIDRPRGRLGVYVGAIGHVEVGRLPTEREGCREYGVLAGGGLAGVLGPDGRVQFDVSLGAPAGWVRTVRFLVEEDVACEVAGPEMVTWELILVNELGVRIPLPGGFSVRPGLALILAPSLKVTWRRGPLLVEAGAAYFPPVGGDGNLFFGQVRVSRTWRPAR